MTACKPSPVCNKRRILGDQFVVGRPADNAAHASAILDQAPALTCQSVGALLAMQFIMKVVQQHVQIGRCLDGESQHGVPVELWLKIHEPEMFDRAATICEYQDYLNYHLTGRMTASICNVSIRWHYDSRNGGYQAHAVGKLHVYPQRDRIGFNDVILEEQGRHQYDGRADDYELFLADQGYAGMEYAGGMCHNDFM